VSVLAGGSDDEITSCSDPDWDYDDNIAALPGVITLILTDEEGRNTLNVLTESFWNRKHSGEGNPPFEYLTKIDQSACSVRMIPF